jgi:hypothetical protein
MAFFDDDSTLWKYGAAWVVMLLVSIANGGVRDLTYGKRVSELTAHHIATATGIVLLGTVIWLFDALVSPGSGLEAIAAGLFWVALTVVFEFVFFHYVGGHPWSQLLADYNVLKGRVWVVLLIWIGVAPYLFFRLRNPV